MPAKEKSFSKKLKTKFRIGTWNVRTMKNEKLATTIKEAERNRIDILGICEHRWANSGHFNTENGGQICYSGNEKTGQGGVALWINKQMTKSLIGYKPISGRLMSATFRGAHKNYKIIQVYAPTSKASKETIENFYASLQNEIDDGNRNDIHILMGDLNAKTGSIIDPDEKETLGKYAYGDRNENGQILVDFALGNGMKIMNTVFPIHPRRLYTWTEPSGQRKHQIDYIAIQKEHSEIIRGVRTLPGADCGTDHELLMAELKLKLRSKNKREPIIRYDVKNINKEYSIAVKNRFSELVRISEEKEPEELANDIKNILVEEAVTHLPKKKSKRRPWISNETLAKIDERRRLKQNKHTEEGKAQYRVVQKQIKVLCKKDKQDYIEKRCHKIEKLMSENKSREMYEEIKSLTEKRKPRSNVIKDTNGKTLTEDQQIANRWQEYCSNMYKARNATENNPTDRRTENATESNPSPPLRAEVEKAIKSLKQNKSPGCDELYAEMIQAGGEEAVEIYHTLITKIWQTEKWPRDWKKSIYVPLPKKGDPQICSNYRTIALISHASKILLNIIMNRISKKLKEEVNETQAGFRKNRGTRDHLLNLTLIFQKFNEMNKDLKVCFIDYSKAFDCVDHSKLWQTLKDLDFCPKIIALIKSLYDKQEAVVQLENITSEPFEVGKGVRQGCILSPHLFSLYTEDIMRKVEIDDRGDEYDEPKVNGRKIRDFRYADDTALLSTTTEGLKKLISATKEHSEDKDLLLNIKKTKIMDSTICKEKTNIEIDGEVIENTTHFDYLGVTFHGDGSSRNEIRKRLAIATQKLKSMENIWKGQSHNTKIRILKQRW